MIIFSFSTWLLFGAAAIPTWGQDHIKCFTSTIVNKSIDCYNGRCEQGECVCNPGWSGSNCNECLGRILLDSDSGVIHDGIGFYAKNKECSWILRPNRNGSYKLRLRLNQFESECGWDYLYIYDGDSAFSPLLASFNGIVSSSGNNASFRPEIVASSGKAFLHFFSDAEYAMEGFNISYSIDSCPQKCSGNGICNDEYGTCSCNAGWTGEACEAPLCGNICSISDGNCYQSNEDSLVDCRCTEGYDCISNTSMGYWKHLSYLNSSAAHGKASLGGVTVNDSMWFYGGIEFGDPPFSNDFQVFNLTSHSWSRVSSGLTSPSLRYGHSMVVHDVGIYVFGGRNVFTSATSHELWMFDLDLSLWKQITYRIESDYNSLLNISALALWGHTATVVDMEDGRDVMIVMFGFHTELELSGFVFEYNFNNSTWNKVIPNGAPVEGTFGHTTTWDPVSRLCFVHGGFSYHRKSRKTAISDAMYSYQPDLKFFALLMPSGLPRFLHSSVLLNGVLLVYGGCTHIDNDSSTGALCFSPNFMAYHPTRNVWDILPESSLSNAGKYGHVSLGYSRSQSGYDDEMIVFGGYNSQTIRDILLFKAYSCNTYSGNETLCMDNAMGLTCEWNGTHCNFMSNTTLTYVRENLKGAKCESMFDCFSCTNSNKDCSWCDGKCMRSGCKKEVKCTEFVSSYCRGFRNCQQCEYNSECQWQQQGVCGARTNNRTASCPKSCGMHFTCDSCLAKRNCMWCTSKQLCVSTTSYMVQFPYGECMEWISSDKNQCPGKDFCNHHGTCSSCLSDPYCGWCDDGKKNGLGKCLLGSPSGVNGTHSTQNFLSYGIAQSQNDSLSCQLDNWYFSTCPICQCNGHSTCHNGTAKCISCQNQTTGDQCERCLPGYYGQAMNGGKCVPCECFGRAESCDHVSGICDCTTKGMTGDRCEKCDINSKYYGDPTKNGSCYYRLTINFSFTFTLTPGHDKSVTSINFENIPAQFVFTEFNFESQEPCNIKATVVTRKLTLVDNGNGSVIQSYPEEEKEIVTFTDTVSVQSYGLGIPEVNDTFRIYVSNFTVPEKIVISLAQKNNELLILLLIIFSCFLILLLFTAALWKLKLYFDTYRRRRQRSEELEQMATRPFASVLLSFEDVWSDEIEAAIKLTGEDVYVATSEMTQNGKYVINTVALQMPSSTHNRSPLQHNSGMFALGSALSVNQKSLEFTKLAEPKPRKKKNFKVIFKKVPRFRRHSGRIARNAQLESQNNCSSDRGSALYSPSHRETSRTEGATETIERAVRTQRTGSFTSISSRCSAAQAINCHGESGSLSISTDACGSAREGDSSHVISNI